MLRTLEALDKPGAPTNGTILTSLLYRAMILTALGNDVAALHDLRQAADRGVTAVTLHYEPWFERGLEPLWANPEYQALFGPRRR